MYFKLFKNNKYHQPYWWVIKSNSNHATLATSEMYARKSDCIDAINTVKRGASLAQVIDATGEN